MLTLTYGFKKPQTGDRGPTVFPAMEENIQKLNDHTHDGLNSSLLSSASIAAVTQTLLAGSWVSQGNGLYKQTVTLPGALTYSATNISFEHGTTGDLLYLTVNKVSSSQYDVFINDNSIGLKVRYT